MTGVGVGEAHRAYALHPDGNVLHGPAKKPLKEVDTGPDGPSSQGKTAL